MFKCSYSNKINNPRKNPSYTSLKLILICKRQHFYETVKYQKYLFSPISVFFKQFEIFLFKPLRLNKEYNLKKKKNDARLHLPFSIDTSFDLIDKLFSPLSADSSRLVVLIFSTSALITPTSCSVSGFSGQYNESALKKLLELLSQLNFCIEIKITIINWLTTPNWIKKWKHIPHNFHSHSSTFHQYPNLSDDM